MDKAVAQAKARYQSRDALQGGQRPADHQTKLLSASLSPLWSAELGKARPSRPHLIPPYLIAARKIEIHTFDAHKTPGWFIKALEVSWPTVVVQPCPTSAPLTDTLPTLDGGPIYRDIPRGHKGVQVDTEM